MENRNGNRRNTLGDFFAYIKSLRFTEKTWKVIAIAACCAAVFFLVMWLYTLSLLPKADVVEEAADEAVYEYSYNYSPDDMDVSNVNLAGKLIIVDAGHGGEDPGSITGEGKSEKEINLEIAYKLKARLEHFGAKVIMTRMSDEALALTKEEDFAAREKIIEEANADMFMSVHQNEFEDNGATGPQVFFVAQGSVGKRLAVCIQEVMNYQLGMEEPRMALPANYRVLRTGSQPSCTIECGFMSNPQEKLMLENDEYQQRLVDAISDGARLYVKMFG